MHAHAHRTSPSKGKWVCWTRNWLRADPLHYMDQLWPFTKNEEKVESFCGGRKIVSNHNYGLEPILLLSPGQLHTHRTCTYGHGGSLGRPYGHGGSLGRPHDHRCGFGRVKIFKNFFFVFLESTHHDPWKNEKKIILKNFCPAKVTPAGT